VAFHAALASVQGDVSAPTHEEWAAARRLRELANALFHEAMNSLHGGVLNSP
jgi:hypothetical protein